MFNQANKFTDDEKASIEKMIKEWDTNGDGQLDSNEFSKMILSFFEDTAE